MGKNLLRQYQQDEYEEWGECDPCWDWDTSPYVNKNRPEDPENDDDLDLVENHYNHDDFEQVRIFKLKEVVVNSIRYPRLLHVMAPEDRLHEHTYYYDEPEFMQNYRNFRHRYLDHQQLFTLAEKFFNQLVKPSGQRGSIEKRGQNNLRINLGKRRPIKELTSDKIALGLEYYGHHLPNHDPPPWTAHYYDRRFYTHCIHPYIQGHNETNPFNWAYERARVGVGMTIGMGIDHDCPPNYIVHPLQKMARLACNVTPEELLPAASFKLEGKTKKLYDLLKQHFQDQLYPETACFILKNEVNISEAMLEDREILDLLQKLGPCFENGLIVFQMESFFKFLIEQKTPAEEALKTTLQFFTSIYGGENEPWWFKENVDFIKFLELRKAGKKQNITWFVKQAKEVAKKSGFAFAYTWPVYLSRREELSRVDGISEDDIINLCAQAASTFGIGNTQRANNVINFALEMLHSTPVAERTIALAEFNEHLNNQKTHSEVLAKMEGPEVTIPFPGLYCLVQDRIGISQAKAQELDCLTLKPKHLHSVIEVLQQPLQDRSRHPALIAGQEPTSTGNIRSVEPKLPGNTNAQIKLLPENPESIYEQHPSSTSSPAESVAKLYRFYNRLHRECGFKTKDIADIYFSFFAKKMPEPLNPPEGFLAFLFKFSDLPTPGFSSGLLVFNEFEKNQLHEKNKKSVKNHYSIIGHLVDLWTAGNITEKQLIHTLNWLTRSIPEQVRQQHAAKITERHNWRKENRNKDENNGDEDEAIAEARIERDTDHEVLEHEFAVWMTRYKKLISELDKATIISFILKKTHQPAKKDDQPKAANDFLEKQFKQIFEPADDDQAFMDIPYDRDRSKSEGQIQLPTSIEHGMSRMENLLNKLEACGLFDLNKLTELWADPSNEQFTLEDFISKLNQTFEAIAEGDQRITRILKFERDHHSDRCQNLLKELQNEFDEINASLKKIWGKYINISSCPTAEFLGTIWEGLSELSIYIKIGMIVAHTRERFFPKEKQRHLQPKERNTVNAAQTVTSIISSALILKSGSPEEANHSPLLAAAKETSDRNSTARNSTNKLAAIQEEFATQIDTAYSIIKNWLLEARKESIGLVPVGGKIHVLHPVDSTKFNRFRNLFGLNQTSFRLIHANQSVILPAVPSSQELRCLVEALELYGIIDSERPELQISITGRLDNRDAAILGSAILLATEKGVDYEEKAFSTTHDEQTGARIMAYDANGPIEPMPFMIGVEGRTDMLGRRHVGDIELYQLLGTVLLHRQTKLPRFTGLADQFEEKYLAILKKYGIERVIEDSWINKRWSRAIDESESKEHHQTIKTCTDKYFDCAKKSQDTGIQEGIIFEVRELFDWLRQEVQKKQAEIMSCNDTSNPENQKTCEDKSILLDLQP